MTKQSALRTAGAGLIGNVLEWFDYAVYGYFSSEIGRQFFPATLSQYKRDLFTFAVFWLGFAARPIGGIVLGVIGDRIGRKAVIWVSILGVAPFALALPYANLFWAAILTAIIGLILSSAFSAILVYAQELVPGKVGLMAGLFFGLAFGMGGIGSAVLGVLGDWRGIAFVFQVCSYLPLIGLLTALLPNLERHRRSAIAA
jgi:MFS family permease